MANDTIWNYINDFISGRINRRQFWVLAEFRHPTHQISFHTLSALNCLTFERSGKLYSLMVEDCAKPGKEVEELTNIFSSFISDEISDFQTDIYYQNPSYLECSYQEGYLLD